MVFGTFDALHPGHDHFLTKASQYGDDLIVVLARDTTVSKIKGRSPLQNEQERLAGISGHQSVTNAVLGSDNPEKLSAVFSFMPDIICLGYDQTHFVKMLVKMIDKNDMQIKIERIDAYKPDIYKSSLLRDNL